MENIKDIDRLNALVNPIGFGDKVIIDGIKYTVGQRMNGDWFIHAQSGSVECVSSGQVNFISNLVQFKDRQESVRSGS